MQRPTRFALVSMFMMFLVYHFVFRTSPAHASGIVYRSVVNDYLFIEDGVGMKVMKGDIKAARKRNREMIEILEAALDMQSQGLKKELDHLQKSKPFETLAVSEGYRYYKRGMSGYATYPTIHFKDWQNQIGKSCYLLIQEKPRVVIRFSQLPDKSTLDVIQQTVARYYKKVK